MLNFSLVLDVKEMNIELTNLNLILRAGSFQNHLMQARHKCGKVEERYVSYFGEKNGGPFSPISAQLESNSIFI